VTAAGVEAALAALLTPEAVRERCNELWALGVAGELEHFRVVPGALERAVECVVAETTRNYPHGEVPLHSRWRHFELGGRNLWHELAASRAPGCGQAAGDGAAPDACARARVDLAVVSVLLDAGAGAGWRYRDAVTGIETGRSEGLALASLRLFADGELSVDARGDPLRADAPVLAGLDATRLAAALQAGPDNPLPGLEQRCELLRRLGATLAARGEVFTRAGATRPGHLYDWLRARTRDGRLPAREILLALLRQLGDIWPHACVIRGLRAGDVGEHPALRRDDASDRLVPLHKLSQWLAYSLVEPFEEAGIEITGLDALTGLAEYRNGGLLIDCGVLELRDAAARGRVQRPRDPLVVEWRALTVAALDRIADRVRARLGRSRAAMPLAAVLQGGTWSAGRRLAVQLRPGGAPPLAVAGDGTLF